MKNFLLGGISALILTALSLVAIAGAGWVNMSADNPHNPMIERLIEWARERAILRQSESVRVPVDLADGQRIRRGAGNYEAMCVTCHLAPGAKDTEIRKGLYPQPPNLSLPKKSGAQGDAMDARRFWIVKHGIMASGMPAWSMGGMDDEAIWDITAFMKVLPTLTAEQYGQRVASSDGHSHRGMAHQAEAVRVLKIPATAPTVKPRRATDDHSNHSH